MSFPTIPSSTLELKCWFSTPSTVNTHFNVSVLYGSAILNRRPTQQNLSEIRVNTMTCPDSGPEVQVKHLLRTLLHPVCKQRFNQWRQTRANKQHHRLILYDSATSIHESDWCDPCCIYYRFQSIQSSPLKPHCAAPSHPSVNCLYLARHFTRVLSRSAGPSLSPTQNERRQAPNRQPWSLRPATLTAALKYWNSGLSNASPLSNVIVLRNMKAEITMLDSSSWFDLQLALWFLMHRSPIATVLMLVDLDLAEMAEL
ncbi:hypothetical protein RRG08_026250 [Elysia crispata]|uniref:Uncharacterized protein n=1 Tax=Elysia crispata TaxID=231223 RepID=A0AAE1DCM1_9GAST|nr:hypothetical protein RRG08_026250 [Elysia crispata]